MTGSGLMNFLIACIGLCGIYAIFHVGIDFIPSMDERLKKIGRIVIGVVLLIAFLYAVSAVLFGGGGTIAITPMGIISFAIGMLVLLCVLYIITLGVNYFGADLAAELRSAILLVVGVIGLIAILLLAGSVLFGGGTSLFSPSHPLWQSSPPLQR